MKRLIKISLMATCFAAISSVGFAANLAGLAQTSVTYNKMPTGATMYDNNPKALFANDAVTSVKEYIRSLGALDANTYTLNIKNENEMNYAVVAEVVLGEQTLNRMGINLNTRDKKAMLAQLANTINTADINTVQRYKVVSPLTKNGDTYVGTFQINTTHNSNYYSEQLHVTLFDDRYAGLSVRIIAIDTNSDAKIWPRISELMKLKTK